MEITAPFSRSSGGLHPSRSVPHKLAGHAHHGHGHASNCALALSFSFYGAQPAYVRRTRNDDELYSGLRRSSSLRRSNNNVMGVAVGGGPVMRSIPGKAERTTAAAVAFNANAPRYDQRNKRLE